MKYYELVLVIDVASNMDTIKKIREEIESVIPKLLDTDDMGVLPLATKVRSNAMAYFLSYYLQSDSNGIDAIKQQIRITRGIIKSTFFSLSHDEKFMKYTDLKTSFEILAERDQPKKIVKGMLKQVEIIEELGPESEFLQEIEVVSFGGEGVPVDPELLVSNS